MFIQNKNQYMTYNKFKETDKQGQEKVVPMLKKIFSGCTLTVDQHWEDSAPVDILVTARTTNNNEYYYCFECKDRWYDSNRFEDWTIEPHKIKTLQQYYSSGYTPCYVNTFKDNVMVIWDINKCNMTEHTIYASKTTVVDTGKVLKNNKGLKIDDAVWKGEMS